MGTVKITVKNMNEFEAEARGVWYAFRDLHHEWGYAVKDFIHAAVSSLGITRQEVEYIWSICDEMDRNDFFEIFEDSYPLYVESLRGES